MVTCLAVGEQTGSAQKSGVPEGRLKSPHSGWALHEASAGFQRQSPRLPIASRIRVASLLISNLADLLSRTAFRGCVLFHMSRAVWFVEPDGGDPGQFKGTRRDFALLPESRLGDSINHSNIPLRVRCLDHSQVDGLIASKRHFDRIRFAPCAEPATLRPATSRFSPRIGSAARCLHRRPNQRSRC